MSRVTYFNVRASESTGTFLKTNAHWLSAGVLLTFMSCFGQTFFISLFAGKIQKEFQLSAGDWGLIYAAGTLMSAVIMIWAGSLADRFRTQRLGIVVILGIAASCLFMALNKNTTLLILAVFLLRFFGQGMATHVAVVAMSRWFVATRGRALAVCALGFTIGEATFPIMIVALLEVLDWRQLWIISAVGALIGIPIIHMLLRTERHPSQAAQEANSVGMDQRHWTRAQVLRHPLLWCMVPALIGISAFNTAFFFHQVQYAADKGWSHLALVSYFPLYTTCTVAAMLASGRALDRFGTASLIPYFQVPMILSFIMFAWTQSLMGMGVGLVLLALSSGANATLSNAFWAEFYGTRHIGSIKAMAAAVMVLGSAIGPGVTGVLLDQGVSLDIQYTCVGAYFLATTLAMKFGINRYRDRLRYT